MRTLYLATPLESLYELLEIQVWLPLTFLEYRQIFGILGQGELHGVVDHVRDRPIRSRRLEPQGPVDFRIEVHGGALGGAHSPARIITL